MHGIGYWILQFLFAAVSMFAILVGIDFISGVDVKAGLPGALLWAVMAAAIFTFARYTRSRNG